MRQNSKPGFDATSFVVSYSRKEEVCKDVDNLSCQENGLAHQTEFLGTAELGFAMIFANQIHNPATCENVNPEPAQLQNFIYLWSWGHNKINVQW